ncbi:MAG: bifunctional adenosylcobinamide kinase/adenosylcobinamide-phosphate guanylyltransferase [Nitrospirae bacterium]|nr:bifunctional adenosylcobinamide kinase/adenosylcobinamide-phosphate guanylyltransferase [Nitrospirota bacterium]
MRTLVLGGTRSGKSLYAESLLDGAPRVRYVATLRPDDVECVQRIRRHRERRPHGWELVEAGPHLGAALDGLAPDTSVLVDGITLWLAALLDDGAAAANPEPAVEMAVARLTALPSVVIVADDVGGGLVPESALARRFRDLAGELNQRLAAACDRVVLVTAGLPLVLKGPPPHTAHKEE